MVLHCIQGAKGAASDTASSGSPPPSLKGWLEGPAAKTGRGASDTLGDPCCASFRCCGIITPDCCHSFGFRFSLRMFSSFNPFFNTRQTVVLDSVNLILTDFSDCVFRGWAGTDPEPTRCLLHMCSLLRRPVRGEPPVLLMENLHDHHQETQTVLKRSS